MKTAPITMRLDGRLWLTSNEKNLAGRGRIDLLARIDEHGSISRAAKSMGMAYKAAWDAVDAMNNAVGAVLVERMTGGRGGGGARLTELGVRLVAAFRVYETEHQKFLADLSERVVDIQPYLSLMERLNMKTSARNQLFGRVSAVQRGAVNDEVELTLDGGDRVYATITHESTESFGLQVGREAFALVKASWIILSTDTQARTSARNTFAGTVGQITRGAVNSEVALTLPGGLTLVAIITNTSVDSLRLQPGQQATALFKASHVILGVTG